MAYDRGNVVRSLEEACIGVQGLAASSAEHAESATSGQYLAARVLAGGARY